MGLYFSEAKLSPEEERYGALQTALQSDTPKITHDGRPVVIYRELGSGGTKTVYDARLDSGRVAMGVPNSTGSAFSIMHKWSRALTEPDTTSRLRDLGLAVNTRCDVVPVAVDNTPLDSIVMHRYGDLPYEVRDSKNLHSSSFRSDIFHDTVANHTEIAGRLDPMVADIHTLLTHGVRLYRDSFNLRREQDGALGFYFNDLGDARIEPFTPEDRLLAVQRYSSLGVTALTEGLTPQEFLHVQPVLEVPFGEPSLLTNEIVKRVLDS
jgi:hypothetical protein